MMLMKAWVLTTFSGAGDALIEIMLVMNIDDDLKAWVMTNPHGSPTE